MTELDVRVATAGDPLPDPAEVQALYAAASAPPPLSEPPDLRRVS
ncbi:hypothetical protein [Goekera deserti]|nr:hypothetical protein [Goekera deserti]